MSSSSSRRRTFPVRRHPAVATADVGCGCRKSKLFSSLFSSSSSSLTSSLRRFSSTSSQKQPKPGPAGPHRSANNRRHPLSSYYPFSPSAVGWDTSRDLSVSSIGTINTASTTFSGPSDYSSPPPPARRIKNKASAAGGVGRVAEESVAVIKESSDPYHDFRDSMLQMIVEKELYGWDDLRGLLHRFLTLNSPCQHDAILRAFSEIWAGVCYGSAGQGGGDVEAVAHTELAPQAGRGQPRRRGTGQHRRRVPREYRLQQEGYGYGGAGGYPEL